MARAIPAQLSRAATSISHRRPARANCVAVAASSVTNAAPARSPMARTIPDPTEHIPGSSKRPARSRSSRISRHPIEWVTKSASSVTNSVTTGITQATGLPPQRTSQTLFEAAVYGEGHSRPAQPLSRPSQKERPPASCCSPPLARCVWEGMSNPVPVGSSRKSAAIIPFINKTLTSGLPTGSGRNWLMTWVGWVYRVLTSLARQAASAPPLPAFRQGGSGRTCRGAAASAASSLSFPKISSVAACGRRVYFFHPFANCERRCATVPYSLSKR
jgi:hypothetical protein